ncbi:MAG: tRNA (N6-threonylcarbamoyladenosine(37)-N6)-methyltransferase TrmO [Candidatus Alcyoniella australis]|nr:tRNA (N6-threonylcarbamoyladenosine(37)-N6)-methyltransferase TrmO [Candidatus Alcyoniella australis]
MENQGNKTYQVKPIGVIHTPYEQIGPPQSPAEAEPGQEFRIELFDQYVEGLRDLDKFRYIYVLYFLDRSKPRESLIAHPPWLEGQGVGLFASRSPRRPNPIALSVNRLLGIQGNVLHISPIDALNNTPLLDIKPYFAELDAKTDANSGWFEGQRSHERWKKHVRGEKG